MTNKEAINWLVNLTADIGELKHHDLWHYEQALYEIKEMLEGKDIDVSSRKGVFIPDITVEMFRNSSLKGVEDLIASGGMKDISLPYTQIEPLTDKEQRIFLAAMGREEKVCKQVDEECRDCREPYEDSLVRVCHEITRKCKTALWGI